MPTRIQLRRGTASQWTSADPVLAAGEPGFDATTGDLKVGDGSTNWSQLPAHIAEQLGTTQTFSYTSGQLTQIVEKFGSNTVKTTTIAYSGNQISTVTETSSGRTLTTTLSYDASGNLTGTTESIS